MEKRIKPRRLISKVRRRVGRETLVHRERNKYDRNAQKRRFRKRVVKCLMDLEECDVE